MFTNRRYLCSLCLVCLVCLAQASSAASPAPGPLAVSRINPRYFAPPGGKAILLAGAHDGWELQDFAWGDTVKEKPFAWKKFLDMLERNGNNVIRLWSVEHTKIVDADRDLTDPMPYMRVAGSGKAADGGDKFDLDRFNPAYFGRLKRRVREARDRGIYVIVMLFQGWSIEDKRGRVNPWPYHPFNKANNVNGVDGDLNGDGRGIELHTWLGENHPITRKQRAYVRRVLKTVGEFDNVLFEIANESHNGSIPWQNHMVEFIHSRESSSGRRHPVGITVPFRGSPLGSVNRALFAGPADWISPNRFAEGGFNYRDNPPPADGRKVVLLDSDHLYGNKLRNRRWVWKAFLRGYNVLFMDRWTVRPDDPGRKSVRRALGQVIRFSRRLDLDRARPSLKRASTRFCLEVAGESYLVYAPRGGVFTVDLRGVEGKFRAVWFRPADGTMKKEDRTVSSGGVRRFTPPFEGDAVLELKRADG